MSDSDDVTRDRLVAGLEASIRKRGYAATTVSDIVAEAGTSKRSFYAVYANRGDCLVDQYVRFHERIIASIETLYSDTVPTDAVPREGLRLYIEAFTDEPEITRAHLLSVLALGRRGLDARRTVTRLYVDHLRSVVAAPFADAPPKALDEVQAMGIVGGINEIALDLISTGRTSGEASQYVVDRATAFVAAVINDLPDLPEADDPEDESPGTGTGTGDPDPDTDAS